ncbi:MAG TPA: N-acetyltransferase [Sphingomonadaceae bacterium]|nr:N-acetyltransferase [Sphingomonadaceae bacterium]
MTIRLEVPGDIHAIRAVTAAAFKDAAYSSQTEARIIDALRGAGALSLSLVAEEQGRVVGHAAFSPVTIDGEAGRWFGLEPVSVEPAHQRRGIGEALIREGLNRLIAGGAEGCVVLGDPAYYGRFGFVSDPDLRFSDAPTEYFQRLSFGESRPKGEVSYHVGFNAR